MHQPINKICMSVSLWATVTIITITLFAGGIIFLQNYVHSKDEEIKKLNLIAPIIINAITGELIIEDERAIIAILRDLKEKYSLDNIIISKKHTPCPRNFYTKNNSSCWSGEIQDVHPKYFIKIEAIPNKISLHSLLIFITLALLPLSLLGFVITYIIQNKLKKSIVDPIISLANDPLNLELGAACIAKEVLDVSKKLLNYINERDLQI